MFIAPSPTTDIFHGSLPYDPRLRVLVGASSINGKGLFAVNGFALGAVIYVSFDYDVSAKAILGSIQRNAQEHLLDGYLRYLNHACRPNCELAFENGTILLFATKPIKRGAELVCDYTKTEDVIPTPFVCHCGVCGGRVIGSRP